MQRVDYDRHQYRVYHKSRAHSRETQSLWREVLARFIPVDAAACWLDVGAGTGRYTPLLAELSGGTAIGVEPSARMRRVADTESAHPRVRYVGGCGAAMPLADARASGALLSMVLHHLPDVDAVVRELARVVEPGGTVLLRSGFADRHMDSTFYKYFTAAVEIDRARLPTTVGTRAGFEARGFRVHAEMEIDQITDASLTAFRQRMETRPFSTFECMSETEISDGFAQLDTAIAAGAGATPIREYVGLMALTRI
jgi:ubiquinone/menaquinone biosynthesis C-methylase UbiE